MIEGDIDLTKNLDFYRKKPKKLLPDNVKLSNPVIKRKSKNNINNGEITYRNLTSTYYNDSDNYNSLNNINISNTGATITVRSNRYSYINDFADYIETYNITSDDDLNSNSTISNVSLRINSSGYTTTFNYRSNITTYSITAACNHSKLNSAPLSLEDIEPEFKLWKHRKKKENKSIIHLAHCSSCGKLMLSINKKDEYSEKCLSCKKNKNAYFYKSKYSTKASWILSRNKPKPKYNGIPWVTYEDQKHKKSNWIKANQCAIPWLNKLNYRIRKNYLEDLVDEDRDNSKYLTDMGWIGVRRNIDDDNEDNMTIYQDQNGIISTISSNIIDAV